MSGVKKLRKLQLGKETVAGTAVAATTLWRGTGTIEDLTGTTEPDEDVGYLSSVDRSYIPTIGAKLELDETEATFQQLLYLLAMGVDGSITPSSDSGTGKIWSYAMATTAQKTPKTYTIEGGDDQQAEEMEYCYIEEFKITGTAKGAVKMSATINGRQVTTTTFTSALSLPTVNEILFGKSTLSIDAVSGTIGATAKSNTLLGFTLTVTTGFMAVFTANGQLYFDFVKQVAPEVTLEITFEHDGTSVAEKAAWKAGTSRQIRLNITGPALVTTGAETTHRLTIDLAGHWQKFNKIDEQDGNDVVTGTFKAAYNATAALFAEIVVVNEVASL